MRVKHAAQIRAGILRAKASLGAIDSNGLLGPVDLRDMTKLEYRAFDYTMCCGLEKLWEAWE